MKSYDITLIGGGPAGYTGAIRAAQLGKKVLLVERGDIGGTCLNRGCIPTKSVISSIKVAESAKNALEFGVNLSSVHLDFKAVQERKERIITQGRAGINTLLKKWEIDLRSGNAKLLDPANIEITDQNGGTETIRSRNIIIATGSNPAGLPLFPVNNVDILDSDTIHGLRDIPASLLIVGGGAIGCEFAYIFNRLGVEVSIVEMQPHLLPLEDEEIAKVIEREFKKKKVKIFKDTKIEKITKNENGYNAELSKGETISAEKILISVGRRPNISGIGLQDIGIETGKEGGIPVNDRMETCVDGLYAAGDVTGKYPLAYVASHEGILASENSAGINKKIDYQAIPSVVFTYPELGSVGLTQKEAEDTGIITKVGKFQFRALGRSHASGELTGMVKVVCDADSDKVIGVHIAGPFASEIVHVGVMAIKNGMDAKDLGDTFFAHPVFSEALLEASWDTQKRSIHKI